MGTLITLFIGTDPIINYLRRVLSVKMAAGSWSEAETYKLIEIWGNDQIQAQLEGCKRNKTVYERIARAMTEEGHSKSATQCREKAKKLKTEYRKVKDKHRVTGEGRKKWKFLEAMDNVLADKPSTQPSTLIDTSISSNDGTPEPCPELNEDNDAEGGNADNNDALSSAGEIPISSHCDENENTITTSDESISDKDAATTSEVEKGQFRLGLCDNAKCYITIIPPIITIIKIFFISNKMLHILFYKRLLARNVSLFTFSGKRHDLFTLTILPVQLKALSEGTDVEGMQRYFRAKLAI